MSRAQRHAFEDTIAKVPEDTKLYDITPEGFSDLKFDGANSYSISTKDLLQLSRLIKGLEKDLKGNIPSEYAVDRLLMLACHLYASSKGSSSHFLTAYFPAGGSSLNDTFLNKLKERRNVIQREETKEEDIDVSDVPAVKAAETEVVTAETAMNTALTTLNAVPPPPDSGADTKEADRTEKARLYNIAKGVWETKKAAKETAETTARSARGSTTNQSLFPQSQQPPILDDGNIMSESEKKFGPFVAAYLFRMLVKTEDNVANSWAHMRDMFKKFYGFEAPVFPTPSKEHLVNLRNELNKDRKAAITWCKIVAEADSKMDPGVSEAGIIRYLAILPLAYAGMHAYKLFLEARLLTRKTNQQLLLDLKSPMTRDGCLAIADILTNHESTTSMKKSGKFRFARILGPQFFQTLQTKHCTELVYCLVQIIGNIRTNSGLQNPSSIAGLGSLNADIKTKLDRAATLIVSAIPQALAKEYSPAMLEAFTVEDSGDETEPDVIGPNAGRGRSMFGDPSRTRRMSK